MDDRLDRVSARRHELVATASGMLAGGVNLIEGMRLDRTLHRFAARHILKAATATMVEY